ncbi:MAG: 6-bladed beta-propeller, partial [Nitrososphaeraceae archaeon]
MVCSINANMAPAAHAEEQQYSMVGKWGSGGSGFGKFTQPLDMAIDTSGNVYVTSLTGLANQIQKFTSNGTFITSWGQLGFGNGSFTNPAGLTIDPSGNVYVSDFGNAQNGIQKFTSNGTFITSWGSTGLG